MTGSFLASSTYHDSDSDSLDGCLMLNRQVSLEVVVNDQPSSVGMLSAVLVEIAPPGRWRVCEF